MSRPSEVIRYVQIPVQTETEQAANFEFALQKKVVLIGQSAGAEDAFIIATLPQAPSLFRAAISESIPNTQLMFNSTIQSSGVSYAQALNCNVSDVSAPKFPINVFR